MKKFRFITIVMMALLTATAAFGQAQTTGSVTGTVVDEAGMAVPNAEVTLTGAALQGERVTQTNSSGTFTVRLLPPGQYTAVILKQGYQAAVMTFTALIGSTQGLDVTLFPGEDFAEEIVVHGRVSPLETTETRATFDYTNEVEELPIQDRNINVVALSAPNTTFGPNAGQVAIAGAPAFDTVVLLDGAEISDPYFGSGTTVYLEDSIQEVQVLTTGISARYGRFQGGVINAVTKSGGNDFSGILRIELDQEDWNGKTPYDEDQSDDLNETYQATLGGYIIRDRLWFFGGYRTIPETSSVSTTRLTGESYTTTSNEDRFQGKLRGAITPNHTIDVSYLEFEAETANRAGLPAGDARALGRRTDPRDMTSISYQGMFGFNTFVDAIATEKNVAISSGGDPSTGYDPVLDGAVFRVFNNHWWDASDPSQRNNETAAINISHMLDTTGFGAHTLEGGVQRVTSTTAGDNRQSPTGYNLYTFTPAANFRMEGGDVLFDLLPFQSLRWVATDLRAQNEVENTALYLQDSITWNNFRFDIGARYDDYTSSTTGVQAFDLDFTDISPRLGVTFNVTPGWQVLGTWGKYVGRFNDSWGENATGVSSAPRFSYVYSGPEMIGVTREDVAGILRDDSLWSLNSIVGSPDFPTTYVADGAEAPYTEEVNLSLRGALPGNSGFASVTYTTREYFNLMTGFTGLPCTDFGLCEGAGDYSAAPGNRLVDTTVWANDPRAKREYDGLAVQFDYRPTARLSVGGNWTWSDTVGNYEGEGTNTPASGSVFGSRERNKPLEAAAPWGKLNSHIAQRANVYGTYRWGLGTFGNLATSAIVNYRTGTTWERTASVKEAAVAEYRYTPGTYGHFFEDRGANEFESIWSLDVALRYGLPLFSDRFSPFLKLDVANVLNNDGLDFYQTTGIAVPVTNADGSVSHYRWAPSGATANPDSDSYMPRCDPRSGQFSASRDCTGFGRIAGEANYQDPREIKISAGLQF